MNKKCYLCGSQEYEVIHYGVREAEQIDVLKCKICGLVWLSEFLDDPDEFYKNSGMRPIDDELQQIRIDAYPDDRRRYEFTENYIRNKEILDFGCGAGGYLHLGKKIAKRVEGIELETKMWEAIRAEGIVCYSSLEEMLRQTI